MLVVDASVLVPALADDGAPGISARHRLRGEDLIAPSLIDVEVVAAWRRLAVGGHLDGERVSLAIGDLIELPLQRVESSVLIERCWELRHTLTIYDATYVALAETLDAPLLTADQRLAKASGPRCIIEVLGP